MVAAVLWQVQKLFSTSNSRKTPCSVFRIFLSERHALARLAERGITETDLIIGDTDSR